MRRVISRREDVDIWRRDGERVRVDVRGFSSLSGGSDDDDDAWNEGWGCCKWLFLETYAV